MHFAYDAKQRPTLLLKLQGSASSLDAMALVDSGADVNVLPWSVGLSLGLACGGLNSTASKHRPPADGVKWGGTTPKRRNPRLAS